MEKQLEVALERAMTIQEVILRAYAGKIKWFEAAEILSWSARHLRRVKAKYDEFGFHAMFDGRKGKASLVNNRVIVFEHLDKSITIGFGEHEVGRFNENGEAQNRKCENAATMENVKNNVSHSRLEKSQQSFYQTSSRDFPTFPQFLLLDNKFTKKLKTGHLMCY